MMILKSIQILILLSAFTDVAFGGKILMIPTQFVSHLQTQVDVAEELIAKGHEVYMAMASRYPTPENLEQKGIRIVTYYLPKEEPYGISPEFDALYNQEVFNNPGIMHIRDAENGPILANAECNYKMQDTKFLDTLRNLKFDLAVVEPFFLGPCNLILPKYLNIPFVLKSAWIFSWDARIPALPSFYNFFGPWKSDDLSYFTNRLKNIAQYLTEHFELRVPVDTTLLKRFTTYSSWKELVLEAQLIIVHFDHLLDDGLPSMPHFIQCPSVSARPSKPLPQDLESVMSQASSGVIYMSFGSSAMYGLVPSVLEKFLHAFAQLDQTILARVKIPEGMTVPKNVLTAKWFPQNDILGHPKTILFITHCGNGGQHEAIYHSVPMLGFPLYAEQVRNCQKVVNRGFGLELSFHDFTPEQLVDAIHKILENKTYASTIEKYSHIMKSESMTGREKAAYWIDHVIKFGGKHLRSVIMDMPLYQVLMLDVIAVLIIIVLVLMFIFMLILKFTVRWLRTNCSSKKIHTKEKRQ